MPMPFFFNAPVVGSSNWVRVYVNKNETFRYSFALTQSDGVTPLNMSGYTVGGSIVLTPDDASPLLTLVIDPTTENLASGVYNLICPWQQVNQALGSFVQTGYWESWYQDTSGNRTQTTQGNVVFGIGNFGGEP